MHTNQHTTHWLSVEQNLADKFSSLAHRDSNDASGTASASSPKFHVNLNTVQISLGNIIQLRHLVP